jgi:hypothetical protein
VASFLEHLAAARVGGHLRRARVELAAAQFGGDRHPQGASRANSASTGGEGAFLFFTGSPALHASHVP